MILILSDRTQAITTTTTPEDALTLLADLPSGIRVRVRPEQPAYVRVHTGTRVHMYGRDTAAAGEPKPAGFFGLAVAQAYDTWGDSEAYQAYLRGEIPDPRD